MGLLHPAPRSHVLNPSAIGDRSEAAVIARLIDCGYIVLVPFGNQRYDLVIEDANGQFWRVQVKTGRLEKNGECIEYNTTSRPRGTYAVSKASYIGNADYFGVYVRDLGKVYLIPVTDAGLGDTKLRLVTPSRGKMKTMRWAADYEL